uniref:F-box domain-containing protein n=2 Tax=Aegilops tauschii subsp. strangulata TaxID=200361 RepID=A0A453J8W1_AEGTS
KACKQKAEANPDQSLTPTDAQEAAAAAAAQTLDEDDAAIALPTMSAMDRLPMELLAEILRRLPPRGIATCRAVRKGWRAAVDSNGLMLAVEHRVPHHVGGIIINFSYEDRPYFFPCGAGPTGIGLNATALDFMIPPEVETGRGIVLDHRNGLLLYEGEYALYVCNPATRRWAELPPLPSYRPGAYYLLFDPTESLHYSVFFFPEPNKHDQSMEWPPSSYMVKVYCSRSGQWDDMTFVREGGATTVAMWADRINERKRHAVYWRGAFYLHCPTGFIIRAQGLGDGEDNELGDGEDNEFGDGEDNEWDSSGESHADDSGEEEEAEELDEDMEQHIIFNNGIRFIGYHPNKEIAFLVTRSLYGFAYYLGTSKLRYLGSLYPDGCSNPQYLALHKSFIYTPCMDDVLPTCNGP